MSFVAFALLLSAPPSLADIPPPAGYEESCTVARHQNAGEVCALCSGAFHGDPTFCERTFANDSLSRRCRTRGASVWDEVWCGPEQGASAVPTAASTPAEPAAAEPAPAEPTATEPTAAEPAPAEPSAPEAAAPSTEKRACAVAGGAGSSGVGLGGILLAFGLRRRR